MLFIMRVFIISWYNRTPRNLRTKTDWQPCNIAAPPTPPTNTEAKTEYFHTACTKKGLPSVFTPITPPCSLMASHILLYRSFCSFKHQFPPCILFFTSGFLNSLVQSSVGQRYSEMYRLKRCRYTIFEKKIG
jgi:hypothetical protein